MALFWRVKAYSELVPFEAVTQIESIDAAPCYEASGDDPRMIWRPGRTDQAALALHRQVRIRVEMAAVAGRLREPCVYFDWGDGFGEETRQALRRVTADTYATVGHSNAGACRGVRFDPSAGPCTFRLAAFDVEGIGASTALPHLGVSRRLARRVLRRLPAHAQEALRRAKALILDRESSFSLAAILSFLPIAGHDPWRGAYQKQFQSAQNVRSPLYAAQPLEPPRRDADDAKVLAFYLPQFHPIPENDAWWGKGFTEWTNVGKATPQFVDHYQPRLPADLGYYDLRVAEVQRQQADQAEKAGVDAFCFHYYWFAGRRILESPLDTFVGDPEINLPFALCWANENWTRRWDGLEQDLLLAQQHSAQDDLAVFADMTRYLKSARYVRVDGKALLIIYRPDTMPEPAETLQRWRAAAREAGLGELFVLCTDAFGFADYKLYGFDGLLEFPPHAISVGEITHRVERLNTAFSGRVYDYEAVVEAKEEELAAAEDPRRFPGVMPMWDNEARKPGAGHVFHGATPELFSRWVSGALEFSRRVAEPGARMVFINAWNEWAEGAYLEPDRWFGYGFAQALRHSLETHAPKIDADNPLVFASRSNRKTKDAIVLLHLYYPDLIDEFRERLTAVAAVADIAISFPDNWSQQNLAALAAAFPASVLVPLENRGRDVKPFLELLKQADARQYIYFCKLHSKRSPHLPDGATYRSQLMTGLASSAAADRALSMFSQSPRLGLIAASASRMQLGEPGVMQNNRANLTYLSNLFEFSYSDETSFPAGTMFWGRMSAFQSLIGPKAENLPFENEMGRIDGALAHAFERAMGAICRAAGYDNSYSL